MDRIDPGAGFCFMKKAAIEKTKQVWLKRYQLEISDYEADEILTNLINYFKTLKGWKLADHRDGVSKDGC